MVDPTGILDLCVEAAQGAVIDIARCSGTPQIDLHVLQRQQRSWFRFCEFDTDTSG